MQTLYFLCLAPHDLADLIEFIWQEGGVVHDMAIINRTFAVKAEVPSQTFDIPELMQDTTIVVEEEAVEFLNLFQFDIVPEGFERRKHPRKTKQANNDS